MCLMQKYIRMCPLQNVSVFDWQSLIVSVFDDNGILNHCRVAELLLKLVNSFTCKTVESSCKFGPQWLLFNR